MCENVKEKRNKRYKNGKFKQRERGTLIFEFENFPGKAQGHMSFSLRPDMRRAVLLF